MTAPNWILGTNRGVLAASGLVGEVRGDLVAALCRRTLPDEALGSAARNGPLEVGALVGGWRMNRRIFDDIFENISAPSQWARSNLNHEPVSSPDARSITFSITPPSRR